MMQKVILFLLTCACALHAEDSYKLETVMAPMRDGVRLATDVYLPHTGANHYPVLVFRSPYNKRGERTSGAYFTRYGYAVVAQDCRGRYASEGQFGGLPQQTGFPGRRSSAGLDQGQRR